MLRLIKETLQDFLGYTSLHGLGRIGAGKHIVQKIIWGLLFLAAACMCFYQVYRLALQYVSVQAVTAIEIDSSPIDFPQVTICNLNPVRFSKAQENERLYQVIEKASTITNIPMESFIQGQLVSLDNPNHIYSNPNLYSPMMRITSIEWRMLFMTRLSNLNISEFDAPIEDFITSCTYNGISCDLTRDFTRNLEDAYGNCYVFYPNQSVEGTGPLKGLSLVLDVESEEYIPFVSESMGVVFDIKRKEDIPTPELSGVTLPTGFHSSVVLSMRERNFLPGEDEKCITEPDGFNDKVHCLDDCHNWFAVSSCSCSHSVRYGQNLCADDFFKLSCSFGHRRGSQVSCPACKDHCRSIEYLPFISMKKWPSVPAQSILQQMFKERKKTISVENMRKSMLSLDIYFSSLTTEKVTEDISTYSDESFFSDIGGQLGLWIGMSVLSLAEICELIVLLSTSGGLKKKKNDTE